MTATGVAGVVSAIRAIRVPHVRQTPPDERGGEVVAVALELEPEREQLVGRELLARRRSPPATSPSAIIGRARAEPAGLRDVVGEAKAPAVRGREALERAHAEMVAVDGAVAADELELVPELERGAGAIEAGAEVGGRGRGADADDHRVRPRRGPSGRGP